VSTVKENTPLVVKPAPKKFLVMKKVLVEKCTPQQARGDQIYSGP
jgi:hypothetical protein